MSKLIRNDRIHVWIPNMFDFKGGIQVYSAFFLNALHHTLDHTYLNVFLKHDRLNTANPMNWTNIQCHSFGRWPVKLRTSAFALAIATDALRQRPRLILSTHLNFTPVAYGLKRTLKIPYWTVAHGVDAWNIQNPRIIQALHHADRILAVSHYTLDRLIHEQALNPEKIVVLPNTFDASRFQIASKPQTLLNRYHLSAEQPIILTVARLDSSERYKGYDQILQALPNIRQSISTVHYILVGKGSDRPRIESKIRELNLEDCVTLAGFVPDEELNDHYNLCDVFAMPSKGEGFGIVYLEALACGKPTVGGNQDGAVDALCQGELGVLVDPDNSTELATTLTQILQKTHSHPLLYQPYILRQRVIDAFGFERFKQTLQTLLSSNLKPISSSDETNS